MDIDTTVPNSGRIYDYLMGGHHNFEADRAAATRILQLIPETPQFMKLNRWFMYHAVQKLAAANFDCYIDLATGLPTQGYLHDRLPSTARILYNDMDPATVAYARQILRDHPNVSYFQSDIRQIDAILREADRLFGGRRPVGICMVGVAYFVDDASLEQIMQRLHAWAAPGSRMALSFTVIKQMTPELETTLAMYSKMGTPLYLRTVEQIERLVQPWDAVDDGFQALGSLIPGTAALNEHPLGNMVGAVVEKRG